MARWLALLATLTLWLALAGQAHAVTFTVTKLADTADGTCNADCSVREAVTDANELAGPDDVDLVATTYPLTLGQLNIAGDLNFIGDGASLNAGGRSRVLAITAGSITMQDLTITGGSAGSSGGGIRLTGGGGLTLERSQVLNSAATNTAGNGGGGGIYFVGDTLELRHSTVSQNTATVSGGGSGGGGVFDQGTGTTTIANSTISRNRIAISGSAPGAGGAGYRKAGTGPADTQMNNVTIVANSGATIGGGIRNAAAQPVQLTNTIVANNSAVAGANCSVGGPIISNGNNLSNSTTCPFTAPGDLQNANANVGGLENNGGPTLTHRLLPGSAAIDAGDSTGCEGDDQRGGDRPPDNDVECDIGAFEFEGLAQFSIPPCTRTGQLPFTMSSPPGVGNEGVNYKIDGGPQLQVPLSGASSTGTGSIVVPEGRRRLEYWGDSTPTGDDAGVELIHHFPTVVVDRTNPNVTVSNPNRFKVFVVKRRVNVNVKATDSISGLTADPSGANRIATTSRGAKTFTPAAVDLCANQSTAPFSYRIVAPRLGTRTVIEELSGRVGVVPKSSSSAKARASQKGQRFRAISQPRELAIGSLVDTRRGTARITSSSNRGSGLKDSTFVGGIFQVLESRARRAKAVTELRLKGGSFKRCRRAGKGASVSRLSRRTIRKLRARAKGRFRTRGRHSSATVRGTTFTVTDRCDGTLTSVRRGRVAVRDFRRKKTVIVRAGKSYFARAPE